MSCDQTGVGIFRPVMKRILLTTPDKAASVMPTTSQRAPACSLTWGLASVILNAPLLQFFAPDNKEYPHGICTDGPSRSP